MDNQTSDGSSQNLNHVNHLKDISLAFMVLFFIIYVMCISVVIYMRYTNSSTHHNFHAVNTNDAIELEEIPRTYVTQRSTAV